MDLGHHMQEVDGGKGPYWLILDARHTRRYFRTFAMDPRATKGGTLTDTDARALREDGTVIEGLYSAGNNSASVMGNAYPGPGSTIAPAVVFGLRGARDVGKK